MKRLIALILSILMLAAPLSAMAATTLTTEQALAAIVTSFADVLEGRRSGFNISLTTPDGQSYATGFGQTPTGASAHFENPTGGILITESAGYVTDATGAYSVELEALMNTLLTLATGGHPLPAVSEADLQLLATIGMELMQGLTTTSAITLSMNGSLLNLHVDLDSLVQHINKLVPQVLNKFAAQMDDLLGRITPALFGQAITLEQINAAWTQLGLQGLHTGLTLDVVMIMTGSNVSLFASCMNTTLNLDFSPTGLSFTVTTDDGKAYMFDTADLLTIASLIQNLPNTITAEALKIEPVTDAHITTTHITADLALMERDIKASLTAALNSNSLTVDALCRKYQPWCDLLCSSSYYDYEGNLQQQLAPTLSSTWLIDALNGLDLLPDVTGEATIVSDMQTGSTTVDGTLGGIRFNVNKATAHRGSTFNASIHYNDGYAPFSLTLSAQADRYGTNPTYTLTCSQPFFGLFNSITVAQQQVMAYGASNLSITTDTDAFHYLFDPAGNKLSLKVGSCTLDVTSSTASLVWPDGYATALVEDSLVKFDSNFFGFSMVESYDVLRIDGYYSESTRSMRPSTFAITYDDDNEYLTASIMPYYGDSVHVTYRPGRLSILADGSEMVIADTSNGSNAMSCAEITFDGEPLATVTILAPNEGKDYIIAVYPANNMNETLCTVHLDFGATGKAAPVNSTPIAPMAFFARLEAILNGQTLPADQTPAVVPTEETATEEIVAEETTEEVVEVPAEEVITETATEEVVEEPAEEVVAETATEEVVEEPAEEVVAETATEEVVEEPAEEVVAETATEEVTEEAIERTTLEELTTWNLPSVY